MRDRLPLADGQRVVAVRPLAQRLLHEQVPRDPAHGRQNPRVGDAARHELRGERMKKRYRLADRIRVRIVRVDLEMSRMDFVLAG